VRKLGRDSTLNPFKVIFLTSSLPRKGTFSEGIVEVVAIHERGITFKRSLLGGLGGEIVFFLGFVLSVIS